MSAIINALPSIWGGLVITLALSALVVLFSLIAGVILGLAILWAPAPVRLAIRAYSDVIRSIPLLVLIFFVYYGTPALGIPLSPFWAAVIALSAFKTGHIIEIVRGAVGSIPRGQTDAGKAIGLTFVQRLTYVILPQALRRFLPPWLNAVTDSVKGSALASLVGVVDLMLSLQQVIGRTYEPMPIYVIGALIYFVINFTLSSASRRLEARFAYVRD